MLVPDEEQERIHELAVTFACALCCCNDLCGGVGGLLPAMTRYEIPGGITETSSTPFDL